jgi:hypothetical protein
LEGEGEILLSVERVLLLAVSTAERDIVLCATVTLARARGRRVVRCILLIKGVTSSHEIKKEEQRGLRWQEEEG